MEIRIDPHTLERAEERGASEAEIRDVLAVGAAAPEKRGRFAKTQVCRFGQNSAG